MKIMKSWAAGFAVGITIVAAATLFAQGTGFLSYLLSQPTGAVQFRAATNYGRPALLGFGTALPTTGNSGQSATDGEVFVLTDPTNSQRPDYKYYNQTDADWGSLLTTGYRGAFDTDDPTLGSNGTGASPIAHTYLKKFWFMKYPGETFTLTAGGACSQTVLNYFRFDGVVFDYDPKGTQAACGSTWTENAGVIFPTDSTANDGYEIVVGGAGTAAGAAANAYRMVAGTDAFYLRVRFDLPTIADTDEFWIGWRNGAAYAASDIFTYDTYAVIGVTDASGAWATATELNGSSATETSLAATAVANGGNHTVDIIVDAAGAVTYQIDGALDASAVAFSFSDAEDLVPFVWEQNVGSATAGATEFIFIEVGFGTPVD